MLELLDLKEGPEYHLYSPHGRMVLLNPRCSFQSPGKLLKNTTACALPTRLSDLIGLGWCPKSPVIPMGDQVWEAQL